MSAASLPLHAVSRLPAPGDNVAIAIRRLEAGEVLAFPDEPRALAHTVLEGHRFAVSPIATGAFLLSWGLPFARALRPIAPGDYVANASMLEALAVRQVAGIRLPATANFEDYLEHFHLDEATFRPAPPVPRVATPRTFAGFRRPGRRGVGTRNTIVILGTTSHTASFARQLAARLQPLARVHPDLDGIVAIAHTEGGGPGESNNTQEILRTLGGFMVHPNVGAVLAVDYGTEPITNVRLSEFMRANGYPLGEVPHQFLTLDRGLAVGLAAGERIVREWLPAVSAQRRTDEPLSALRVALQCGGSDAFSGVSGNPLAGALVHEVIRHGGTGVLTETDESMGAESYMLKNVRDLATARAFIGMLDAFREKLTWHGLTAESNPSAGNRFRGLYNIALKSLGAVHKKDPRTRIDTIIRYAQPLRDLADPGFTFMNGPGNDLEGIAGQVAAGCNLLLFVTGNGSITNFPFVPTLKITTTTRRHNLLIHEMDINAGRYLDGEPMETLTADAFEVVLATASGRKTKGDHAGHSQVSIWRNWRQTDTSHLAELRARPAPDGIPLARKFHTHEDVFQRIFRPPSGRSDFVSASPDKVGPTGRTLHTSGCEMFGLGGTACPQAADTTSSPTAPTFSAFRTDTGIATERIALILPTSMCSTQVARLAAEKLNAKQLGRDQGISRFVAFTHSEGCGFGGEAMYRLLQRTYHGYVVHPNVAAALLLEHGCEKIPNDVMRRQLESVGLPLDRYGWASVQLDGGIEKAIARIEAWFASRFAAQPPAERTLADFGGLSLGLLTSGTVTAPTARVLARLASDTLSLGGSVVLHEADPLLANPEFAMRVLGPGAPRATLAYGQPIQRRGLHVVASETEHAVENITGFGGNGTHLVLTVVGDHALQGHPMLPVLQVAEPHRSGVLPADDIDLFLSGDDTADLATLRQWLVDVAQCTRVPVASAQGFVDFQLTRGLLGLTT